MMAGSSARLPARPVVGILCCNETASRPVQAVASRFVTPLATLADATVLLVPAIREAVDVRATARVLDGLLLTGSRSNVAPHRYGGQAGGASEVYDEGRDEVALALAGAMIEAGKPVFGICRGLQELNVLFGGTLSAAADAGRHHRGSWDDDYQSLFAHRHDVLLTEGGHLSGPAGTRRLSVNSVHEQGIDRLGGGLSVEAVACDDGLVEAISSTPCGGDVLAVQWHPEWDVDESAGSRAFFTLLGRSLRRSMASVAERPTAPRPLRQGVMRGH